MSFFSRLTDIVTCNLTHLLAQAEDPKAAIAEIIQEMREGISGAQRSVNTAMTSEDRLRQEIDAHRVQVESWTGKAKEQLLAGAETDARQCLLRKREVEDLIAGLSQQHKAAIATREHLATMHRALEARLAEAMRRQEALGGSLEEIPTSVPSYLSAPHSHANDLHRELDAELEALRQELKS
ncbi:PspA/IM30 family protein [Schlesneria paludicola]|uniref:PspA/IM30 family protein n=1 Tax=Schlesneria paludicola TaxID=360056 RepID=UPI00029A10BD|nr:PspA/IM30 family protein [Schlesneria paludicola]